MCVYESNKSYFNVKNDEKLRREKGVEVEVITAKEVLKHEPNLQPFEGGAHFFPMQPVSTIQEKS